MEILTREHRRLGNKHITYNDETLIRVEGKRETKRHRGVIRGEHS